MHRILRNSSVGGLGLVLALAVGSIPASASNISDLATAYTGSWHSITTAENENLPAGLAISATSTNGKFTGFFQGIPITGKVSSKGVITFKGKSSGSANRQTQGIAGTGAISKGKAQLSATGRFIGGTFTYKGTGGLAALSGKYLFSLGLPVESAGEVAASARPEDLATRYLGNAHNSTLAITENLIFDLSNIVRASNGKITAKIGDSPVSGKVSRTGKVTFGGKSTFSGGTFSVKAAGQLSATGKFYLGAGSSKGTGSSENQTGKFTFESTSTAVQPLSVSGESSLGRAR